jgi:hypothetical protein
MQVSGAVVRALLEKELAAFGNLLLQQRSNTKKANV